MARLGPPAGLQLLWGPRDGGGTTLWAGRVIKMGRMPLEWTHYGIMLYNFPLLYTD